LSQLSEYYQSIGKGWFIFPVPLFVYTKVSGFTKSD
jgi:hypothetical protein